MRLKVPTCVETKCTGYLGGAIVEARGVLWQADFFATSLRYSRAGAPVPPSRVPASVAKRLHAAAPLLGYQGEG